MVGTAVEQGVTINVLVLNQKKNCQCNCLQVKGKPYNRRNGTINVIGKASNVNIVSSSGDPGAGSYVQIRGQNTITGNTQPLYVVDGIPISSQELDGNNTDGVNQQSRVADINPNSIESVTIQRASASALWGFRAANGVILITTKR
jgi:TonB-dependent SusC/RagA subfamily outer membrane receptor